MYPTKFDEFEALAPTKQILLDENLKFLSVYFLAKGVYGLI